MKDLRLLLLAAILIGITGCSVTVATPTPTPRVVALPANGAAPVATSAPARVPAAAAPAATPTPAATVSPSPTRVLRAPLPSDLPIVATALPARTSTATPGAQPAPAARPAPGGRIVLQTSSGGAIVAASTGGAQAVTLNNGLDPAWSPDGKQIAFTRWTEPQGIYVMNADGSNLRLVYQINGAKSPTWSPDGAKIAFTSVYKQERRAPRPGFGGPSSATDYWRISVVNLASGEKTDVMLDGDQQAWSPSWGPDGRFVYKGIRGLFVTTETGWPTQLTSNPLQASPAWSPDGSQVAFMVDQHDHWDIAVVNSNGGGITYVTSTPPIVFTKPVNNVAPSWSPDGRSLAFLSDREGDWRVYVMDADGSNQRKLLDIPIVYDFAAERVLSWTK